MNINKSELRVAIDVDGTLIIAREFVQDHSNLVEIICPYTMVSKFYAVHKEHVDLLKSYKKRGYHVTVWSANGWKWAQQVAKKLLGDELEQYVDEISSKYIKFVDDLPAEKVLGTQVFIPFNEYNYSGNTHHLPAPYEAYQPVSSPSRPTSSQSYYNPFGLTTTTEAGALYPRPAATIDSNGMVASTGNSDGLWNTIRNNITGR